MITSVGAISGSIVTFARVPTIRDGTGQETPRLRTTEIIRTCYFRTQTIKQLGTDKCGSIDAGIFRHTRLTFQRSYRTDTGTSPAISAVRLRPCIKACFRLGKRYHRKYSHSIRRSAVIPRHGRSQVDTQCNAVEYGSLHVGTQVKSFIRSIDSNTFLVYITQTHAIVGLIRRIRYRQGIVLFRSQTENFILPVNSHQVAVSGLYPARVIYIRRIYRTAGISQTYFIIIGRHSAFRTIRLYIILVIDFRAPGNPFSRCQHIQLLLHLLNTERSGELHVHLTRFRRFFSFDKDNAVSAARTVDSRRGGIF